MTRRVKSDPPDDLTPADKRKLGAWCREKYPTYHRDLREILDGCLDWHRANGVQRVDWLATARNWVRQQARIDGTKAREKPQEARGDVISIDQAFRDAAGRLGRQK